MATVIKVYICDQPSPWQRGSNENTNGLLRQYSPKGSNLSKYSQAQLNKVALQHNQRPRQTLDSDTPAKDFMLELHLPVEIAAHFNWGRARKCTRPLRALEGIMRLQTLAQYCGQEVIRRRSRPFARATGFQRAGNSAIRSHQIVIATFVAALRDEGGLGT